MFFTRKNTLQRAKRYWLKAYFLNERKYELFVFDSLKEAKEAYVLIQKIVNVIDLKRLKTLLWKFRLKYNKYIEIDNSDVYNNMFSINWEQVEILNKQAIRF